MERAADSASADVETLAGATAWIDQVLAPDSDAGATVAFIGSGLGYALDALERRHPAARAIVFEPDVAVARAMLARRDWSGWLTANRLAVVTGPDYTGAAEIARRFPHLHRAPTLVHPRLADTRPDEVEAARVALARVTFQTSANEGARRQSAGRYLLHTLANLPRLARESNVAALTNVGAGLPAVIAAAGPSLDENIHDLWPVRDRAIVIACDTAARPLLSVGIEPDLIVAADPSRVNAGHLASLPASRSWLVAEGSVHPSGFVNFDSRTFIFNVSDHHPWPWLRSLGLDRARLETWGSVATSAFSLALLMGCDPIIFVGADFAFTGNRPYCRGTSFEPQWAMWAASGCPYPEIWQKLVDRWPAVTVPDLRGEPARTARHLVSFRDWMVERASASGRRIVNATRAGLFCGEHIEQRAAAEVLDDARDIPREVIDQVLRAAHATHPERAADAFRSIDALLRTGQNPVSDAWIGFSEGTVSAGAIDAALRSAEHYAWSLATAGSRSPEDLS